MNPVRRNPPTLEQIRDAVREEIDALDRKFTERFDTLEGKLAGLIDDNFPVVDADTREIPEQAEMDKADRSP